MTAYGDFDTVRQSLEFLRQRQRADGKMMHELSQGAHYLRWFEDFPYGYYHADTTPLYITAVRDYVRASGDVALAKTFWPSIRKAYDYCVSTDEDGDGLMDNTKAGLAAVETGALRRRDVLTDVFLAAAWTEAAGAAADLAAWAGDVFASTARVAADKARASLNARFLDGPNRRIFFAVMKDGKGQAEHTVWPAFGLWRGVFDAAHDGAEGMLDELAGAGVGADWGARMLSNESALYEPLSYNNGASWPFLTGFAALALYTNGRPDAAWGYLDGLADLTFLESRGYMAELFSGDRLRSVDAAVPHQLFATTGFVSTVLRGLVGLRAAGPEPRGTRVLPERLILAPQLPAGWGWLRIRNLRWQGVTADLAVTRGERSYSVSVSPRGGTLPLEFQATFPPETLVDRDSRGRPTSAAVAWQRLTAPPPRDRGARFWRFEAVAAPTTFGVAVSPGIEILPVHPPLALGDAPSRLRVIDTWMAGGVYYVKVEGRRGGEYRLRLRAPYPVVNVTGALVDTPDGKPGHQAIHELVLRFPPAAATADPAARRTSRQRDWMTQTISVAFGR
jgi:hypothetical protein